MHRTEEIARDVRLLEAEHRARNVVQMISALLRMEIRRAGSDEARSRLFRVLTSATAMDRLQRNLQGAQPDGLQAHLAESVALWREVAGGQGIEVRLALRADTQVPRHAALPLALIAQELISNAFEHAFPDGRRGMVVVHLTHGGDGSVSLIVEDDGAGFDASAVSTGSLGLDVVRRLAGGCGARVDCRSVVGAGTVTTVDLRHAQ